MGRSIVRFGFFSLSLLVFTNGSGFATECAGQNQTPLGGGVGTKLWNFSGGLGFELAGGISFQAVDSAPAFSFSDPQETVKLVVDLDGDSLVFTSRSKGYTAYRFRAKAGRMEGHLVFREDLVVQDGSTRYFSPLIDAVQLGDKVLLLLSLIHI